MPSSPTTAASSPPGVRRGFWALVGHAVFRLRNALFPIVLLLVGFGTRPVLASGDIALDHVLDAVGVGVALLGQALRVRVLGLTYVTRAGQNQRVFADALVEKGVFAVCRNPLYVGNLLIIGGVALVHNGWVMYLVAVPFFALAYSAIVSAEEEYLRARFGSAYERYCRRVPRWIPSRTSLSAHGRALPFEWRRALRMEYGTPFGWLSGVLLLLVWEHQSPSAPAISEGELGTLVAVWILLLAAYLVTMTLKLRGRLGPA